MDIFPNVFLIRIAFFDQLPAKAQCQCAVGAGFDTQMKIRVLGCRGDSGVNYDDLHAPGFIRHQAAVHQVGGNARIGAEAKETACIAQIRLHHFRTGGAFPGKNGGSKAGGGLAAIIHRTEGVGKPL